MTAVLLGGWLAAALTTCTAWHLHRERAERAEAVARATHELRGALHVAGLVLDGAGRRSALMETTRSLQLELDKAARAASDIDGAGCGAPAGRFDLAAVLESQTVCWAALAAASGRELEVVAPQGPLMSHGDPVRVAQVLGNLVANALEHGAGRVRVAAWGLGAEGVVVSVADEGGGLPDAIEVLAGRARRGRGRRGRGLAIASGIVGGFGGRLSAEPVPGGSRLIVEIPARVA